MQCLEAVDWQSPHAVQLALQLCLGMNATCRIHLGPLMLVPTQHTYTDTVNTRKSKMGLDLLPPSTRCTFPLGSCK